MHKVNLKLVNSVFNNILLKSIDIFNKEYYAPRLSRGYTFFFFLLMTNEYFFFILAKLSNRKSKVVKSQ